MSQTSAPHTQPPAGGTLPPQPGVAGGGKLGGLTGLFSADPAAAALAEIASGQREETDLIAPPGFYAPLLASLLSPLQPKAPRAPVVIVTATGAGAEELAAQLQAYVPDVAVFPAWETLPHERLSPRADTMAQRIAVLRRILHPEVGHAQAGPLRAVVMPLRAAAQPIAAHLATIPPVSLQVGDTIGFADLVARLVDLGYERSEVVTRRGELAVRGGIIDVFPAHAPHPLRLEFFGEEIDDIRTFSVADQRTIAPASDGLWAPPCREVLLGEDLREKCGQLAQSMPGVAEILEQAAAGIYPEGLESLAGVLQDDLVPIFSLLEKGTLVVAVEPQRLEARAAELIATTAEFLAAAWSAAAGGGKIPVSANNASFKSWEQLRELAERRSLAWANLGQLETGQGQVVASSAKELLLGQGSAKGGPVEDLGHLLRAGYRAVVGAEGEGSGRRLTEVLNQAEVPAKSAGVWLEEEAGPGAARVIPTALGAGVLIEAAKLILVPENEVLGRRRGARRGAEGKMPTKRRTTIDPLQLKAGDYVVHVHHGIGRFVKLEKRTTGRGENAVNREYVVLEYAPSKRGQAADQLWVPSDSLDLLSKYVGGDAPALSKMGGSDWAKAKTRARKAVREIAAELIRLYAARQATKGHAFSPDTPWQRELEDAFPYVETPDQLETIDEVKADMEKPIPMDRLVCGDVGFGKTEIAVRAAFKAVQDGKQVAVLAPTTLLVSQHQETFSERYAGFPVTVAALSRFSTAKEAREIKAGLADGSIEVVVGTHSLLTGDVRFKDLGLVIIDEEQRFGVEHKEALKALRTNVDVLSMSATPIPRTLEMAVTGIRQMSTLATPPEERHPVLTFVGSYTDQQVQAAVRRELLRDGQVFYVHNRVESIERVSKHLQSILPEARVRYAHGQMSESQLEKVMVDFWNHEFDVLVSTTIVENGLDITNANTIIIDRADALGLSQLHQLRGRVGRGRERGYAYFLYPAGKPLTETAFERLRTIAAHSDLGSGIQVAQKDLEIRGAGNLLGGEQSGHIAGVGFDLYIRMVGEAIAAFNGEYSEPEAEVAIEIPVDAYLPEDYIGEESLRLEAYTRLSNARQEAAIAAVYDELTDRYGRPPAPVQRLFQLARLRLAARAAGIYEIKSRGRDIRFAPVTLADSQQARLKRLHPGARLKLATREVLIPAPTTGKGLALEPVVDEELMEWIAGRITNILTPFSAKSGVSNEAHS